MSTENLKALHVRRRRAVKRMEALDDELHTTEASPPHACLCMAYLDMAEAAVRDRDDISRALDDVELEVAGFDVERSADTDAPVLVATDAVVAFARAGDVYAVCIRTERGLVSFDIAADSVRALSDTAGAIDFRREQAALEKEDQ